MIRRVAVLAVFAALAVAALDVWLFVVNHGQAPVRADAIVVLSGSKSRLPVGVRLMRAHDARLLVISRNDRPSTLEQAACARRLGLPTLCVRADPFSTQGEARLIARLATARGWRAVEVVTSQFHVYRARLIIRRCYHGRLTMIGAPNPGGFDLLRNLVLEPIKLVYHELRRGC
ncbi:MAG TPA: YdcF family protein [Gaiellaceae bacterium]|nr:YdcF family protein [Gaiellaceae bacterium]